MTKIAIPHLHRIEGEAGFWTEVTRTGEIKDLRIKTLEGLRQIEGILIGRRFPEIPIVVARICGICSVAHIVNACSAIEKALKVEVSETTVLLRKLILASQIIQSHTLHLFFLSLADFFDIDNDLVLMKKFPKETESALKIRDFGLEITKIVGGREIHPMALKIGGFSRLPEKEKLAKMLDKTGGTLEAALILANLFKNLDYPDFSRETQLVSLGGENEYPFYSTENVLVNGGQEPIDTFFSAGIKEELKSPPVKRARYRGKPYMLGAIARVSNNSSLLNPVARKLFFEFKKEKKNIFSNTFFNIFYQAVEVVHFIEESEKLIRQLLKTELINEAPEIKIKKGKGLSAMEAPRGTLFTYFELDERGRIKNCNIITPTAQFLDNIEADLREYLPTILKVKKEEKIRKIRAMIRVYDPCISCATH